MRRRDGLHGLAIQWGPIGDVGLLADDENLDKIAGVVKQRMNSCLEVMDKFLQFPDSILSSTVTINLIIKKFFLNFLMTAFKVQFYKKIFELLFQTFNNLIYQ